MDERLPPGAWSFTERHTDGYMDLPRIREGGLDAEFFAIYTEREPRPGMAVKRAIAQIEAIHTLCEKYPDDILLATTAEDVRAIAGSGRVAALMGLEGGHIIEDELLKRGYDEATIRKVLGENTLRVMREVEAVAAR